jgi:hypothetical protein
MRGLPVLVEGWKYFAGSVGPTREAERATQVAA